MSTAPSLARRAVLLLGCLVGVASIHAVVFGLSSVRAQQEAQLDERIKSIYARTQTAASAPEYTAIIADCEALAADAATPAAKAEYVRKLASWAYNRRGEAHAAEANRLADAGDERAAEFDAVALADFEKSLALDPTRWKALHNRGVSRALAGQLEQAVADFSRVLELKKDYPNTWFNRGEIRYELGQYEAALADYHEALRLNPADASALTSRGHTLFELRRLPAALDDYEQVVKLQPGEAAAYVNRGEARRALGQWEQAASDLRAALRLNPELGRAHQGLAWLLATCPNERLRNPEQALQAAQRAIELDGEADWRYLDTLAAAQANAGQFAAARETLAAALPLAPESARPALRDREQQYAANQPHRDTAP